MGLTAGGGGRSHGSGTMPTSGMDNPLLTSAATPLRRRWLSRFQVLWGLAIVLLALVLLAAFLGRGPWAWAAGFLYISYESWLTLSTLLASRRALVAADAARPAEPSGIRPRMAVLIAARNECAALPTTLAALEA